MQFTQSGVSLSFEVTYDSPTLDVGMTVFDDSGLSPIQVGSILAMDNFKGNSYRAKFTATSGKSYLFHKAVYTDNTFTTIDDNYSQASESIRADDIAGIVLDAPIASYETPGSVGEAIATAANTIPPSPVDLTLEIDPNPLLEISFGG